MRYDDSTVIGLLGGGYGEPPVRVADLEEAARRRAAARLAAREGASTHPVPPPDPEPAPPPDPDPVDPAPDPQPGPP